MPREAPIEQRLLGQTLAGKYKLVEVQASGAFGTVFHAHQSFCRQFVRPVAVKVSRQTGLTEETAPYLFGDALVLARLLAGSDSAHDNGRRHLVHIYDMGLLPEHEDRAFLVMEYVDGLPLISHMRAAGRVSVATGLRLLKQICRALALVHAQGAVHRDEHFRLKRSLSFPPPSEVQNEIRFDHTWLDPLILRCLEVEPARRFADAGVLLAALEACEADGESALANFPPGEPSPDHPATTQPPSHPTTQPPDETEALFREVRRLLAARAYDRVVDSLDVHRPPEWVAVDLTGARTLRALGQAYLGLGDLPGARDCLEQLRSSQRERPLLLRAEYAAALSDLVKCYKALGQPDLARARQEEVRGLL